MRQKFRSLKARWKEGRNRGREKEEVEKGREREKRGHLSGLKQNRSKIYDNKQNTKQSLKV